MVPENDRLPMRWAGAFFACLGFLAIAGGGANILSVGAVLVGIGFVWASVHAD